MDHVRQGEGVQLLPRAAGHGAHCLVGEEEGAVRDDEDAVAHLLDDRTVLHLALPQVRRPVPNELLQRGAPSALLRLLRPQIGAVEEHAVDETKVSVRSVHATAGLDDPPDAAVRMDHPVPDGERAALVEVLPDGVQDGAPIVRVDRRGERAGGTAHQLRNSEPGDGFHPSADVQHPLLPGRLAPVGCRGHVGEQCAQGILAPDRRDLPHDRLEEHPALLIDPAEQHRGRELLAIEAAMRPFEEDGAVLHGLEDPPRDQVGGALPVGLRGRGEIPGTQGGELGLVPAPEEAECGRVSGDEPPVGRREHHDRIAGGLEESTVPGLSVPLDAARQPLVGDVPHRQEDQPAPGAPLQPRAARGEGARCLRVQLEGEVDPAEGVAPAVQEPLQEDPELVRPEETVVHLGQGYAGDVGLVQLERLAEALVGMDAPESLVEEQHGEVEGGDELMADVVDPRIGPLAGCVLLLLHLPLRLRSYRAPAPPRQGGSDVKTFSYKLEKSEISGLAAQVLNDPFTRDIHVRPGSHSACSEPGGYDPAGTTLRARDPPRLPGAGTLFWLGVPAPLHHGNRPLGSDPPFPYTPCRRGGIR